MSLFVDWMMTPRGLALDKALVKWTGHSILNRIFARAQGYQPAPALLLMTTGRKSGATRSAALPYFLIDGVYHIVGSKGGAPDDPNWVTNIRANSKVTIYVRRRAIAVNASILKGEARERAWSVITAQIPTYLGYQKLTTRELPVIALIPIASS